MKNQLPINNLRHTNHAPRPYQFCPGRRPPVQPWPGWGKRGGAEMESGLGRKEDEKQLSMTYFLFLLLCWHCTWHFSYFSTWHWYISIILILDTSGNTQRSGSGRSGGGQDAALLFVWWYSEYCQQNGKSRSSWKDSLQQFCIWVGSDIFCPNRDFFVPARIPKDKGG